MAGGRPALHDVARAARRRAGRWPRSGPLADRSEGGRVERRDQHLVPPAPLGQEGDDALGHGSVGSRSGSGALFLISMFTPMPRAGVEGLGQGRDGGRQLGGGQVDDGPAVGQGGVVVDDQRAVGGAAGVQLDPVGARGRRPVEGLDRVLREGGRRPPVGDHDAACDTCAKRTCCPPPDSGVGCSPAACERNHEHRPPLIGSPPGSTEPHPPIPATSPWRFRGPPSAQRPRPDPRRRDRRLARRRRLS